MTQDFETTGVSELDLAQYNDEFRDAPVEEREFEDVPDGKYQVNIDRAELVYAQSTGAPMLALALRILGPTSAGRVLRRNYTWKHTNTETRKFLHTRLKTDLATCGVVINELTELPARLGDLLDVKLEINKRTKEGNSNIYVNRRIVIDDLACEDDSLAPF